VDGLQTRTCTDEDECGTEEYRPFESQPCSAEETAPGGPSPLSFLTGMVTGLVESPMYMLLLLILRIVYYPLLLEENV